MIKEFAIEPHVLVSWKHFRELRADFGVGCGRLICKYPGSWTKDVIHLIDQHIAPERGLGEVQASSIKSFVTGEKHLFISSRGRPYDRTPPRTWLQNAEESLQPEPFDGIIALENPRSRPSVLVAGDFDRSAQPYAIRRQIDVKKSPETLATCASKLLLTFEELTIVDPYFDLSGRGYVDTLLEMLDIVRQRQRVPSSITLHVRCPDPFIERIQKKNYQVMFSQHIPEGCRLDIAFWRHVAQGMHARYLLTELGGLKYDWGFDAGREADHMNEVILLEHARAEEVRGRYAIPSPNCTVVSIK